MELEWHLKEGEAMKAKRRWKALLVLISHATNTINAAVRYL